MFEGKRISEKLLFQIRQAAVQYHHTRLLRCWVRFGLLSVILVALAAGLFGWVEMDGMSKLAAVAGWVVIEAVLFVAMVMYPMRKAVSEEQIALHIEACHPELENRIISALSFSHQKEEDRSWMMEKFFQESKELTTQFSWSDVFDSDQVIKLLLVTACFVFMTAAVFTATHSLWIPHFTEGKITVSESRVAVRIEGFQVEPGHIRIKQGESLIALVKAEKELKTSAVRWRQPGGEWDTAMMEANATQKAAYYSFDPVQQDLEYQVVFGEQRSEVFMIDTWLPPKVESMDLTYTYPDYLQREPKQVPNSGKITAIEGTEVKLDVWVNKPLESVDMVMKEGGGLALTEMEDSLWTGFLTLRQNDSYHLVLTDDEGNENEIQTEFSITVGKDHPPEIKLGFPRDDMEVTMLEEIPFDVSFSDDYGLEDYGLQYEIAGKEPVRVSLREEDHDAFNVKTAHTLRLESLGVVPGDLITWSAWAKDQNPDRHAYDQFGDPFFIEIKPYRRLYQEAMSNAGADQQQQQQQKQNQTQAGNQKQIIIAIWNLRKSYAAFGEEEYVEKRDAIHESQSEVLAQTVQNGQPDSPHWEPMLDAMNQVLLELQQAELPQPDEHLTQALKEAQMAHHLLLKMEPEESQVQQSRQQGGGGGGGGQQNQMAEINDLELNRQRNFYEQENRTASQAMEETNQALDKLKELTQRQKSLNEEIARLISEMEQEKDREELRRQLERLQEEERSNLESLDELQRDLAMSDTRSDEMRRAQDAMNDARDQMNETLQQLNENQLQEARASGARAVNALNNMEDQLENLSRGAAEQRMRRLQDQMRNILEQQDEVISQIREIQDTQERANGSLDDGSIEQKEEILQTKRELTQAFEDLIQEAAELSERSTESQELMSQKLGDWLRRTSQQGILEDMQQEERMPLLQYGIYDKAAEREQQILEKLAQASEELHDVADYMVQDDLESMRRALSEMRELLQPSTPSPLSGGDEIQDSTRALAMNGEGAQSSEGRQGQGQQGQGQQNGNGGRGGDFDGERGNGRQYGGRIAGGFNDGVAPFDAFLPQIAEDDLPEFLESGYRDWLESLRNAEGLLSDTRYRDDVTRIREEVEEMRKMYRDEHSLPKYDLFLEKVAEPLAKTTAELQREIEDRLKDQEIYIADEGSVPYQYENFVAEYFKRLSESESEPSIQ